MKRQDAARRKILNILPRKILEEFSQHSRPHTQTKRQLVELAVVNWNEGEIRDEINAILRNAA